MSFNVALSGLSAAQADLAVTSNNIANVNTTGFKESRAEFGDIFATSSFGSTSTAIGTGVLLTDVAQQFGQGNLNFTGNTLDLAITGDGFFIMSPSLDNSNKVFTRAGLFGVNDDGFVVNNAGAVLQVFPVNPDGTVTSTSLASTLPLQLPQTAGSPSPTTEIELGVNLPADATALDPANFDPLSPTTFSASTSITFFDSLGESHVMTSYFIKDATSPNSWAMYLEVDGQPVDVPGGTAGAGGQLYASLQFDNTGVYQGSVPATITTEQLGFTNGSDPTQTVTLDLLNNDPTQFASPFTVNTLNQNGFSIGRLTGITISDTGVVRANFTNGQSNALGKVALARFPNPQGLAQLGNTTWDDTIESGEPLVGEALTASFGQIRSGALEESNVDLTQELVNLITAQRNFQANARTIETNNQITQTIIQIR